MELCGRRPFFLLVQLTLVVAFVWIPKGVCGVEARMESHIERCCGLGTLWAANGVRCTKFTGPVSGVPQMEQGICLEAFAICCDQVYREKSCEKGKEDARAGSACMREEKPKKHSSEQQRDCCKGCKLGISMGSMGQGCAFKTFSFGEPWNQAFLDCCKEPSSTTTKIKLGASPITISSANTTLTSFNTKNEPEDRCKTNNPCEQFCDDTGSEVTCGCKARFILSEDGHSCLPVSAPIDPRIDNEIKDAQPKCSAGYQYNETGQVCDDIDECIEGLHSCENKVCYNLPGSYTCGKAPVLIPVQHRRQHPRGKASTSQPCKPGMKFVRNSGCKSNEKCKKTRGSFFCECKFGFERHNITLACVDINECQLMQNNCSEAQACVNTVGSYFCVRTLGCGTGYTLNADTEICEEIDECIMGTHDCQSGYRCRNTRGSYRCDRISSSTPDPPVAE